MRGVVVHAPRDLRIEELADGQPGPGEVRIRIGAGGICGSDLHYFNHGGTESIRLREPMILGHEIAGTVAALGDGVSDIATGTRVAINPSQPCGRCEYCLAGLRNQDFLVSHAATVSAFTLTNASGAAVPAVILAGSGISGPDVNADPNIDADSGFVVLVPTSPLPAGRYTATLRATVAGGRALATSTWSFSVASQQ